MNNNSVFFLKSIFGDNKKLLSVVKAIGLENPKDSSSYRLGQQVRFSGWVLPLDAKSSVEWLVKSCGKTVGSYLPSVKRPDVQRHFSIACDNFVKHGFDFSIATGEFDCVCLKLNEVEIQVWSVDVIDVPNAEGLTRTARGFRDLHKLFVERDSSIDVLLADNFQEILSSDFKLLSARQFISWRAQMFGSALNIESAFKILKKPDWPIEFIANGSDSGNFSALGVLSDGEVCCRFGIVVGDFNYLFFSNREEYFYLVQHCANVCLVFPEHMLVVGLSEVGHLVTTARDKLPELYRQVREHANSIVNKKNGHFLGICLTQSRPYHYIYDYLFGLNLLSNRLNNKFDIYGVAGFDFFDVSFFENCKFYESLSNEQLNKKCLSAGGFLVMPCVQYICSNFDRELLGLASKLVNFSNEFCAARFPLLDALDADLVIWIGVSNEKRSWIEQVDGFSRIIQELSKKFNNISVFVDGRTFPISPREADFGNKIREDKLFDDLVLRCPEVSFFNMIGLQPVEKIYLAQKIDFFISSYATDSIYPSAICGKSGVVYVAPSIGDQRYLHIHHDVIEVPSDKVKEVEKSDGVKKSWHETSISMNWRDVFECVQKILGKHGVKNEVS